MQRACGTKYLQFWAVSVGFERSPAPAHAFTHRCHSFLVFGILFSYLPQHIKLISRRTSEGLSPYFILLGTTSSTCAIANILTLPDSHTAIGCCKELSSFSCTAGLLGIAQIGVQWSCFFAMYARITSFEIKFLRAYTDAFTAWSCSFFSSRVNMTLARTVTRIPIATRAGSKTSPAMRPPFWW